VTEPFGSSGASIGTPLVLASMTATVVSRLLAARDLSL
jgi:hypothetical protein